MKHEHTPRTPWFTSPEDHSGHGRSRGHGRSHRHVMEDRPRRGHGRGGGRGGGRRGWGRRGGARAGRGDVRAAILMLLAEQPMHGYQIIQQITERSAGAWQPSPGSVYPALQLLEDQALIQAEEAEGRRTYQLTDAGRTHVEERRDQLAATWAAVKGTADDATATLRDLVEQVEMAASQVARVGAPAQLDAAREVLSATRQQLYLILADDLAADQSASADSQP